MRARWPKPSGTNKSMRRGAMGAGPVSSVIRRLGWIGVSLSKGVRAVVTGFGSFCRLVMRGRCFSLVYHMGATALELILFKFLMYRRGTGMLTLAHRICENGILLSGQPC